MFDALDYPHTMTPSRRDLTNTPPDDRRTAVVVGTLDVIESLEGLPPVDVLVLLGVARTTLDAHTTRHVIAAREGGASWADIARALGITKQAAHHRYARIVKNYTGDA
jgi:hypothetical protein